jgi:solute carrier family 25 carnitine/acylcarnitine transporter 20/29
VEAANWPGLSVTLLFPTDPKMSSSAPSIPLPSKEEVKQEVQEVKKKSLAGLRSLVAGGVGGICAVIVGHPFDLVKVRLQTAERGVYTGAIDVVRKTIAREGLARVCTSGNLLHLVIANLVL